MKISFISKMAWQNIKSNRKLYIPYMMAASTTVAMFIMMSALLTNKFVQERSAELTSLFGMGTIVIGIFSLIFIFYTNSFLMKRRKKELGLYSILGLEKKHVNTILVCVKLL
ncbi:FtsX-like permease family protein [Marinilactibacillus psychrotolerans]|uniref:FtsX-like permease family protein n=1 Tax=Marinilactibacillus psychrotolerans TaxID=191770 RepID=UPI00388B1C77